MFKRSKKHPMSDWSWWQVLLGTSFAFGLFGAMPGFLPPISADLMRLGVLLSFPIVISAIWNWWTYNWWARLAVSSLWTVQLLAIVARAWSLVMGVNLIWIVPVGSAYLLAWVLPLFKPQLSEFLWWEQVAPQTRLGRTILALALGIGPSAGVLGAAFGMFGNRFGEREAALAVGGALASFVAISVAFGISYQLWPERPWARESGAATKK